ncbi:hypothetical protein Bealeia2_02050 (plasmid) [Candidatus Bealeia paramacronuclearis]|uniref:hypothetical protein n=1 Tax=Candidatus Bealeia paramacronuclearis TaxID=1921001 RepID=UPI002B8AF3D6|nr:hypothetical protein [Candidatus Bealeia paramacronuclearis]
MRQVVTHKLHHIETAADPSQSNTSGDLVLDLEAHPSVILNDVREKDGLRLVETSIAMRRFLEKG